MHKYVDLIKRCFPFIRTVFSVTHTYVTFHEWIASQKQLSLKREERRKQASASSLIGMPMVPLLKVSLNRPYVLYSAVLYSTLLYSTLLYSTLLYCAVLYCTVLYCTVLYCTVLYCTVLYSTVLYSAVRYCTVMWLRIKMWNSSSWKHSRVK